MFTEVLDQKLSIDRAKVMTSQLTIISIKAYPRRVTLLWFGSEMMNEHEELNEGIMGEGAHNVAK